jgi:3-mercaptopyruvate sulfurtransferase SseA
VLADHGRKNVHPLYGGFDVWVKEGLPVERKEEAGTVSE